MKIDQTIRTRYPDSFEEVEVTRKIDIEITRNGEPVEVVASTAESVIAALPFPVTKIETYLNLDGTPVYRGEGEAAGKPVYFWVEKIF